MRYERGVSIPNLNICGELFSQLQGLYEELQHSQKSFPEGACYRVSSLVEQQFGLEKRSGFFAIDYRDRKYGYEFPHGWNIDVNGVIVDLTAAQFNASLVKPLRSGVLVVGQDDPRYKRYIERQLLSRL